MVAPIYYDDVIIFGLTFTTGTAMTDAATLFDEARCQVEVNTRDDDFWIMTHEDGYIYLDAESSENTYAMDS